MKKYIHVTKEVRQELAEVFKVGDRAVWNALSLTRSVVRRIVQNVFVCLPSRRAAL